MGETNEMRASDEIAHIEAILTQLERDCSPLVVERVRELLRQVLALHARGLERVLTLADASLVASIAADPQLRPLLLLHDLHPDPPDERLRRALAHREDELRRLHATARYDDGRIVLRHRGDAGVRALLEQIVLDAAPDADVEINEEVTSPPDVALERLKVARGSA